MPKVSVIIPTYNRVQLLMRAISSVRDQTTPDWEMIVVDDCSTDDIPSALASIADARIQFIRQPIKRGAAAARNTGFRAANGEWIAFLDSDDEWVPQKLEQQLALTQRSPAPTPVLVYTGFEKVGWPRQPLLPEKRGLLFEELLVENVIGTCSTPLISARAFEQVGGFDESLQSCQDWDLWLRLSRLGDIDFIAERLARYYPQEDSITMNRSALVAGHRRMERKWSNDIRGLPPSKRGQHYLRLGINYYWGRSFRFSLLAFLHALVSEPRTATAIVNFLLLRRIRALCTLAKSAVTERTRL